MRVSKASAEIALTGDPQHHPERYRSIPVIANTQNEARSDLDTHGYT